MDDVAVRVCVRHLEACATAQVCDSARLWHAMRIVRHVRNAKGRVGLRLRVKLRPRDVLRKVRARERRVRYTAVVSPCATAHR